MADVVTTFSVTTPSQARPDLAGLGPRETVARFQEFLDQIQSGSRPCSAIGAVGNASQAVLDATFTSLAVGHVIEVNGVNFTATNGAGVVAYNEFDASGDDDETAAAFADAVNASTDARVSGIVTATFSGSGVVRLTADGAGYYGNAIRVRNLGILASAVVTCAGVQAADTVTINGTTLTATQKHATGTFTLSNCAVGAIATINGVAFTAVASGANGLTQFNQGGTDTQDAASLATAINANPSLAGVVTATSALGVVTVRYVNAGTAGNAITLAASGSGLSKSGTTLANGAAVANNVFCPTGSNTQVAADLVRAIGASSTALVSSKVTAKYTAGAVTITARDPGVAGNANTIATSNGTRLAITGSVSRLAGADVANYTGTQASGTIVITGADGGNYTATINGVATGNVAGTNGDDNATAASIAAAIASLTGAGASELTKVSVATNTITVTAIEGGIIGNMFTMLASGTGAVAAARLTGGAAPTSFVLSSDTLAGGSSDTPISASF